MCDKRKEVGVNDQTHHGGQGKKEGGRRVVRRGHEQGR